MALAVIVLTISIFLSYSGKRIFRTISNPVSIYTGAWAVSIIANIIFVIKYKGFQPSDKVYWMILCTEFIFSMVFILATSSKNRGRLEFDEKTRLDEDSESRHGLRNADSYNFMYIFLFQVLAIIVYYPKFIDSLNNFKLMGTDSFAMIRGIQEEHTMQVMINEMIRTLMALPVIYAVTQVTMKLMFDKDSIFGKKKTILIILSIIDILMVSVASVGRFIILTTFLYFVINYFAGNVWNKISRSNQIKIRRYGLIISVVLIAGLIYITKYRSYGLGDSYTDRILYTVTAYIGAPLTYFDTAIDIIDRDLRCTYGTALFSGLWDYPLILFQRVINIDFLRPLEIVYLYNAPLRQVNGYGLYFTAFPTVLLNMYLDGRLFGVIFDSLILGVVTAYIYKKAKAKNTNRWILLYNYTFIVLIYSILHWDGNRMVSLMVYFYLYLFTSPQIFTFKLRRR